MALNQVHLMGRLVADPELRKTNSDVSVTSFRIAVDRDYKNQDGEREADFINISAWRGTADFIAQYFARGDMIVVSGRLQTRRYEDKDGNPRTATDVVADKCYFGGSKTSSDTESASSSRGADGPEEDLPFWQR